MIHLAASLWLTASEPQLRFLGACRLTHGRMFLANGAPSVRIWIIGTRRVLGVAQQDEDFDKMPEPIRKAWGNVGPRDWRLGLYGDFDVCPLTKAKRGEMQSVWVRGGKNLSARRF